MIHISQATQSTLITESGFSGYDHCLNPYVGCQFGCMYCYVRFFVKDKQYKWGEFVRHRSHITTRLPRELTKVGPTRLVIGTMTDPYQPIELKLRLTRTALQIIAAANPPMTKVGIYTRSPRIIDDIDLIKTLPGARVHFTVTPFSRDVLRKIEPIPIMTEARFRVIEQLKKANIKVNVNVAPAIPIVSEPFIDQFAERMAQIGVDEFFVDPMQPYKESLDAIREAMKDHEDWKAIEEIITNKSAYKAWKNEHGEKWIEAWGKQNSPNTLPILCDHAAHTRIDMRTRTAIDWNRYGDDLL